MSYAKIAAGLLNAWCASTFSDAGGVEMASICANGSMIDCFDHAGGGTHKYIPADELSEQLGLPSGSGVYGYWKMNDGSYLLRTCPGPLAHWDGVSSDTGCQWGQFSER